MRMLTRVEILQPYDILGKSMEQSGLPDTHKACLHPQEKLALGLITLV